MGVSASGKTTWAKEYVKKNKAIVTSRDDLRFSLTNADNWGDYKHDNKIERMITDIQYQIIAQAAANNKDIIIADTNLNPKTRLKLTIYCEDNGYIVEIKPFPISLEEAWKRDSLRENGVGRAVIYRQWLQWLEFIDRKKYIPNPDLPRTVVFDIDGTLAHMTTRGPFDWKRVGEDDPDLLVREILWGFFRTGYKIVLLSGRDGSCREETYEWCREHDIVYDGLFMRQANDNRKDSIIKEELFWNDVAPYYNVIAIFDDRPQVIRMWHDLGIPKVIAVADQNIEF